MPARRPSSAKRSPTGIVAARSSSATVGGATLLMGALLWVHACASTPRGSASAEPSGAVQASGAAEETAPLPDSARSATAETAPASDGDAATADPHGARGAMADAPDIASTPGAGALVMDDVRGDAHAPAHAEVDPRVPRFAAACTAGERVRLHAVGDVLLHQELQRTAYADERGARALWVEVEDLLADAELTIANLESPLAPGLTRDGREAEDPGRRYDSVVYTAYPSFNVHPLLARGLVESGVDLVTTANNHALDRGPEGIDRTIRELRRAKLPFVGTRTQADAQRDRTGTWSAIATAGPLRVGVVACTEWVNQRPDPQHQVLRCKSDRAWIEREVKRLRARDDVDVVVVAPHWGKEYAAGPAEWQRSWAQRMIDAGASLVLGGHPHVLQPWERLAARDGREAGVVWSLGNFASHQQDLPKRSEAIVQVGLVRDAGGATHVAAFAAHPIHQARDGERFTVRSIVRDQGPHDAWDHVRGVLGRAGELTPGSAWWDLAVCDDTASAP